MKALDAHLSALSHRRIRTCPIDCIPMNTARRHALSFVLVLVGVVGSFTADGSGMANESRPAPRDSVVTDANTRLLRVPGPHASSIVTSSPFRDYRFDVDSNEIGGADRKKAREVSEQMLRMPSLRVELVGTDQRRLEVVRDALIGVGIRSSKSACATITTRRIRTTATSRSC